MTLEELLTTLQDRRDELDDLHHSQTLTRDQQLELNGRREEIHHAIAIIEAYKEGTEAEDPMEVNG